MYVRKTSPTFTTHCMVSLYKDEKMVKGHICCHVKHNLALLFILNACCGTYTQYWM